MVLRLLTFNDGMNTHRYKVQTVHGAGEHSGRHEYFGTRYASKKNCALWALDLPGLGQSAGVRGHIEDFGDYLEDVGLLVKMVRSALPCRSGNTWSFPAFITSSSTRMNAAKSSPCSIAGWTIISRGNVRA